MKHLSMSAIVRRWLGMALVLGFAGFGEVRAENAFGVRSGFYSDADAAFIGAEFVAGVGRSWFANPNLEYAFVRRGELLTLNGDFHYDFVFDKPYWVWLGTGPAVILRDSDVRGRDTDLGVNLLAGVGFRNPRVSPYVQMKVTLAADTLAIVGFGLRF